MEAPQSTVSNSGRKWLWLGIALGLFLLCVMCVVGLLLFKDRLPGVAGLFATATPTPTETPLPIPGIDTPVTIDGLELQLYQVSLQDTYQAFQTLRPQNPGDTLLVVKARHLSGDTKVLQGWKVTVTDEKGAEHVWGMQGSGTLNGEPEIFWVFAVPKESRRLTLNLPQDHHLDLTPLLQMSEATATPEGG